MHSIRSKLSKGKSAKSMFQRRDVAPIKFLSFKQKSDFSVDSLDNRPNESEFPTETTPLGLESNLNITRKRAEEYYVPTGSGPVLKLNSLLPEMAFEINPFPMNIGWDEIMTAVVPEKNPLLWMIINGVLLIFTVIISLSMMLYPDSKFYMATMEYYVGYSLFNSIIWILQILLDVWYHASRHNTKWTTTFELFLAAYFGYTSIMLFIKKEQKGFLENYDCRSDMILNFVAYLYLYLECLLKWRTQDDLSCLEEHFSRPETQNTSSEPTATSDSTNPYLVV